MHFVCCCKFQAALLTLKAPITTKIACFCCLRKCFRSLLVKQCRSRSDCSSGSTLFASKLILVNNVSKYTQQLTLVDTIYSPALKKWGLYWICVVCHSVHPSVRHNFVSAQYLEKYFIESNQILYVHLYCHDLPWDCYIIFQTFVPELWPLINAEISFPLNILRTA